MRPHLLSLLLIGPLGFALGCSNSPGAQNTSCIAPQVACGNVCVDTMADSTNCGACGTLCPAGQSCQNGVCGCPTGTSPCAGQCISTAADPLNCGACGQACGAGQSCVNGACQCQSGLMACAGGCTSLASDAHNCGFCDNVCIVPQVCSQGVCTGSCAPGEMNCDQSCVILATNPMHCGSCGNACPTGQTCQAGQCMCSNGLTSCNSACVDVNTSAVNCGTCGVVCSPGQTCTAGSCVGGPNGTGGAPGTGGGGNTSGGSSATGGGTSGTGGGSSATGGGTSGTGGGNSATGGAASECNPACTGSQTCVNGTCQCPDGSILCDGKCVSGTECPQENTGCDKPEGMISDFEDQSFDLPTDTGDSWSGGWEAFNNEADSSYAKGTQDFAIEENGDGDDCNKYSLHTKGSGWGGWVGVGLYFKGNKDNPEVYDASAKWKGIRFRAKKGSTGSSMTPVRFNISIPKTEGSGSGGLCSDGGTPETSCYNHLGRFLYEDNELTNEWKSFAFCFDRDFYPLFLPSLKTVTLEDRTTVAKNLLKIQFQFNKAKNLPDLPEIGREYDEYDSTTAFDFWVDDVQFVASEDECPGMPAGFTSTGAQPFGQNKNVGKCAPVTDAAKFNATIARAYERWVDRFVKSDGGGKRVNSPEQGYTPSEAMGYGLMIAAAMGDHDMFDQFLAYTKNQGPGSDCSNLMTWKPGDSGSATDADEDIVAGLIMADEQWGGYAACARSMAGVMFTKDVVDGNINLGSNNWGKEDSSGEWGYNPSYFTPAFYPAFQALTGNDWTTVGRNGYGILANNAGKFGNLVSDWCNKSNGTPRPASVFHAQVTGAFKDDVPVSGYDAARVPWRLGLDACVNSPETTVLAGILSVYASMYDQGNSIDLLKAGFYANAQVAAEAEDNQISFIGPVGVGAMAISGRTAMRDRAFRAVLDIIENPEFNRTYYPTTLGLIMLLTMSGNFPPPTG